MTGVADKVYENEGNQDVLSNVPREASLVLDVGCGAGDNARALSEAGHEVDGVTLSPEEARLASKYCRSVLLHDLEEGLPPEVSSNSYDCVICSHVIEHLRDPSPLLKDIGTVLRDGYRLVAALPNPLFYKNRFKLIVGRVEYEGGGLMDETHYKWYTYRSAQELLEAHGFKKIKSYVTGSFPIPFIRRVVPRGTFASVDRAACRLFPGLFGYQMIFVYTL